MNPVVIDTNCLLQIIARKSPYRPIWDAFLARRFDLCVSNEILEEYQEILGQQITPTIAENVVLLILNQENVQLVDPHFRMGIITADPDDNKFVDCAFAAGADYLVSEDSHFKVLHQTPFPQLNLVTLDEFLNSRLIEALPMDADTRERIASSVCEKSAAFPSSLIIKLLDLRNINNLNLNFNLIERYILCASPENLALILRYWPKNKILSDTTLNNLLRSSDANILVPLLSLMKQNFPQEASKHAKRISELKDHSSPAVRAWARMLKQD